MLQAVIYYIVTTMILTKELVIATDQCTEHQFKSPFFPGACKDIYNKNPESHDRLGYYWILNGPRKVYCGMNYILDHLVRTSTTIQTLIKSQDIIVSMKANGFILT